MPGSPLDRLSRRGCSFFRASPEDLLADPDRVWSEVREGVWRTNDGGGDLELHNRTTEVLREVREAGAEYVVTYQGHPIAVLLPVDTGRLEKGMLEVGKQEAREAWERYARLASEARAPWPALAAQ